MLAVFSCSSWFLKVKVKPFGIFQDIVGFRLKRCGEKAIVMSSHDCLINCGFILQRLHGTYLLSELFRGQTIDTVVMCLVLDPRKMSMHKSQSEAFTFFAILASSCWFLTFDVFVSVPQNDLEPCNTEKSLPA